MIIMIIIIIIINGVFTEETVGVETAHRTMRN